MTPVTMLRGPVGANGISPLFNNMLISLSLKIVLFLIQKSLLSVVNML